MCIVIFSRTEVSLTIELLMAVAQYVVLRFTGALASPDDSCDWLRFPLVTLKMING